jgi:hypothetical protein
MDPDHDACYRALKARDVRRMRGADRDYVPAFGKDCLLPFFAPFVKSLGADGVRSIKPT